MNDDHHDSFSFAAIHVCDVVAAAISGEMTLNAVAKKYYTGKTRHHHAEWAHRAFPHQTGYQILAQN